MKVKNKEEESLFKNNHFVLLVGQTDKLMLRSHDAIEMFLVVHLFIEVVEELKPQVRVVHQTPLSSAELVAVVITLPREVDPLRMAELVSHEIKICLATQTLSQ